MAAHSTEATRASVASALPGALVLRTVDGDARLRYYLYVPRSLAREPQLLVAVHGISRNAREHGHALADEAERRGVVLLAPSFAEEFFPDFQRLGVGTGQHPDIALERMVADVELLLTTRFAQFWLFGYSGGGQFAHRYALAYPQRVAALAVASAGWYTWPRAGDRFPYGLEPSPARRELRFDLAAFLRIPLCVLIGALDTRRDESLRRSRVLDSQQGRTRLERARNWFNELVHERERRGLDGTHELRVLASSDHDFLRSVRRDRLDHHLFDFLGATTAAPAPITDQ
jgi:pimeloyl-ACP methyl ester carboxylesterase